MTQTLTSLPTHSSASRFPSLHCTGRADAKWQKLFVVFSISWLGMAGVQAQADGRSPPVPAAKAAQLGYAIASGGMVIVVPDEPGASVRVQQDGQDLLMSFAQAAPEFDVDDFQRQALAWIKGVSVGYDSLLMHLAPGVGARWGASGSVLELRLAAQGDDPESALAGNPGNPGKGSMRLDLLEAQTLLRQNDLVGARKGFEALRLQAPEDVAPVLGLAAVESQAGRWRRSLALYQEALAAEGGHSQWLSTTLDDLTQLHGDRVHLGVDERRSHGGTLEAPVTYTLGKVQGVHRLNEAWRLNMDLDTAHLDTDSVRRTSGALAPFSGERVQAALGLQRDAMDGSVSVGTLFLGQRSAGLGGSWRLPDDRGITHLLAEGGRPNWDYAEGMVSDTVRDRLALGRNQRLLEHLSARLEVGLNRYHQPDLGTLGRSHTLAGELRLDELAKVEGLAAVYALDGEYVDRSLPQAGTQIPQLLPTGARFSPLPLVNREVHSATLGYARTQGHRRLGGALTIDIYAGLAGDRYGRQGNVAAASLTYAKGPLEFQLRGGHVGNVGRSRGTTDLLALRLQVQI